MHKNSKKYSLKLSSLNWSYFGNNDKSKISIILALIIVLLL